MYAYLPQLSKVVVETPDHPRYRAEPLWAAPLGGDLYEVRTLPCCADGLRPGDVVRAVPEKECGPPKVVEVVRRAGHGALLVAFSTQAGPARREAMLRELRQWQGAPADCTGQLCAIAVGPGGDHAAVCERLRAWEGEGLIAYEGLRRRLLAP